MSTFRNTSIRWLGPIAWLPLVLAGLGPVGCLATGRVETGGAEVLDLVARQTELALEEYERDLQAVDADRRAAVVQSLAQRVRRDGVDSVDAHGASLLEALEKIAADRQAARRRYEAAMDNLDLLHEVAGGLRRYGERLRQFNSRLQGLFPQPQ